MAGLEVLKKQIDELNNKFNAINVLLAKDFNKALVNLNTGTTTNVTSASGLNNDIDDLKKSIDGINSTLRSLSSAVNDTSIKFGNLGFSSIRDAKAWCELHLEPFGYGWVFDFHILLQQVWTNISGQDLVKTLTKGFKLDIENGHQLATIGSFETSMPRFLKNIHGHFVTQRDQSFFSCIKNWAD